jgi:hypothetical protein
MEKIDQVVYVADVGKGRFASQLLGHLLET